VFLEKCVLKLPITVELEFIRDFDIAHVPGQNLEPARVVSSGSLSRDGMLMMHD